MNKIKKALLTLGLAAGLAVGGTALVEIPGAETANALTKSQCYTSWYQIPGSYSWNQTRTCYYDYNWWEETFQGQRDGWYYEWIPGQA